MNKKYKILAGVAIFVGLVRLAMWYFHGTSIPVLEPRGPIAQQERHLIFITCLLALIVVIPVFGLLFGFAWRYREGNPKKPKYSPDLAGNRIAETIWWLIPSAIILVMGIIIWNSSHTLDPYRPIASSTPPMTIQVVALDWKWLFIYPQQNIASVNFVQFPVNTPVAFQLTSDSVMNSFWIPQLGSQIYAMPGMNTQLHLLASSDGNFYGSSANISGSGFAGMNFIARASSEDSFKDWVSSVKHSSSSLSTAVYSKLDKPSTDNPAAYYASAAPGLYNTIIDKYLAPIGGSAGISGVGASGMAGMEMR